MGRYVEATIGQARQGGEPQSPLDCSKCKHFDVDMTLEGQQCHDCYPSKDKFNWVEREEDAETENGILEHQEVGCQDCESC